VRWVWRGTALGALLLGWIFVAWQNHFHVTAPLVFVCLAYLAVVATVYNLFRTGAAAVAAGDDDGDSTWAKQTGALGELEREKRTLLKAIKEAEFDHQMGKLSKHDVDEMIRVYRARAIEVIKEIDQLGAGAAGTTREQIMREVRARIELDARAHRKAEPAKAAESDAADKRKGKDKKRGKGAAKADETENRAATSGAEGAAASGAESAAANGADQAHAEASSESAGAANHAEPAAAATIESAADAASAEERAAESLHDEAMDADSTTTVESTRNHRAKEATP
jgi:hypothetical protein